MSKSQKLRKNHPTTMMWKIIFPNGIRRKVKNLARFCRNNDLDRSNMYKVSKGILLQHKVLKCINI